MIKIPAGKFKAKCLKIMDEVQQFHREVIVTKHGKPVVRVVPIELVKPKSIFGCMKGSVIIKGDIIRPTGEKWSAER